MYFTGNYTEAEKWLLLAATIREKLLGQVHIDYVLCLHSLGLVYRESGLFEKSERMFLETKVYREKIFGREHVEILKSLGNLISLYRRFDKFDQAEKACLEYKEVCERTKGKNDLLYAGNLVDLAIVYTYKSLYKKAEALYLESIDIQLKSFGNENLIYNWTLNSFANMYRLMGNFEKAELIYFEILDKQEKTKGKINTEYAEILVDLAKLFENMGNSEKAESFYLEAIKILEKTNGKQDTKYAINLMDLANYYNRSGQYLKAEQLYLESKIIMEINLGKENDEYSRVLNNLANLYVNMNQNAKAEILYLNSKDIEEKNVGKENPKYATSVGNLAMLYNRMGNYEKAESLYSEAMTIIENTVGKENQKYADCVNNFGSLYFNMGQFEKAESFYTESKNIKEKILGKNHPNYATSLKNLAIIYYKYGQYQEAEKLFLEASSIFNNAFGIYHELYLSNLLDLARLFIAMGYQSKAETKFLELSDITRKLLEKALYHLSENELNNYLEYFSISQDEILLFAQKSNSAQIFSVCYDNSLFYKGFLLNSNNQLKRLANSHPTTSEKFNQIKTYGRRLAIEYSKSQLERDSLKVVELEEKINSIEKDLALMVAGYQNARLQIKWQDVQSNLKPEEAAIEFVQYNNYYNEKSDSTIYAALLVRPGKKFPSFIPLFEQRSLDSLLNFHYERKADYANQLYTLANRGAIALNSKHKTLYELIWKPIEKELIGIKKIYYSPTGLLHRININAIPMNETETLADMYKLVELSSNRQLGIRDTVFSTNRLAILYGGLQYDQDNTAIKSEGLHSNVLQEELSFRSIDSTLRGGSWDYLAGTLRELKAVNQILSATGFEIEMTTGHFGTEESFKNIGVQTSSPRILHIATHGYFFPDVKEERTYTKIDQEPIFKISEHPMLRSGLILSGGNAGWKGEKNLEEKEDGVLTAYEISQMNLSKTELVVLSACETGLGDIQGNEGVYGLQRAFKIAGAKYLIMSLWQVPDKQTSLLMTTFYKKWLEEKMSIPEAFHAAQKELREMGFDPYQWAGFVLVE